MLTVPTSEACWGEIHQEVQISRAAMPGVLRLSDGRRLRLAEIIVPISTEDWAQSMKQYYNKTMSLHLQTKRAGLSELSGHLMYLRENEQISNSGWLQHDLIKNGIAAYFAYPGETGCAGLLKPSEQIARANGRGIWDLTSKMIVEPLLPAVTLFVGSIENSDLVERHGQYVIIHGQIKSIGQAGRWHYLNFDNQHENDFTARLAKHVVRQLHRLGISMEELAGKQVEIRGILQLRGGPLIEIFDSAQVSVGSAN